MYLFLNELAKYPHYSIRLSNILIIFLVRFTTNLTYHHFNFYLPRSTNFLPIFLINFTTNIPFTNKQTSKPPPFANWQPRRQYRPLIKASANVICGKCIYGETYFSLHYRQISMQ